MKLKEKNLSRKLRLQGYSINEICRKLSLAKSSVSIWVRDIKLTTTQKENLSSKGIKKEIIERRRTTRLIRENAKRQIIINEAKEDIDSLSKKDLFLIGIALYWAEGSKSQRNAVKFSNSDSRMIKLMMRFFKDICRVPEKKLKGYIHIHHHLDVKKSEDYWSSISKIPLSQFYKTYRKPNKGSQNKKDSLPFGTFDITICDTKLFLKIQGWINGICKMSEI
ncbi:hypothetical protein KAR26_01820 [Candidatus Parcubacteria bacterium]|nr:hypothetical protein [Candidatus Parcubacteria bacterium]